MTYPQSPTTNCTTRHSPLHCVHDTDIARRKTGCLPNKRLAVALHASEHARAEGEVVRNPYRLESNERGWIIRVHEQHVLVCASRLVALETLKLARLLLSENPPKLRLPPVRADANAVEQSGKIARSLEPGQ
jgi:hypothetical protein